MSQTTEWGLLQWGYGQWAAIGTSTASATIYLWHGWDGGMNLPPMSGGFNG